MKTESTCRVWKSGKTGWVITIPQTVREVLNINEGDILNVSFEVVKANYPCHRVNELQNMEDKPYKKMKKQKYDLEQDLNI